MKKDAEAIKQALKSEFESAHHDHEVELDKVTKIKMEKEESPQIFVYILQPSQDAIARCM